MNKKYINLHSNGNIRRSFGAYLFLFNKKDFHFFPHSYYINGDLYSFMISDMQLWDNIF